MILIKKNTMTQVKGNSAPKHKSDQFKLAVKEGDFLIISRAAGGE